MNMIGCICDGERVYEVALRHDPGGFGWAPGGSLDLAWLARDPCNVEVMRSAVQAADARGVEHRQDPRALVDAFEGLVSSGIVQLQPVSSRPLASVFCSGDTATPSDVDELVELAEEHFVEFRFVDPRGNAVSGVPYVLHDPDGVQTEGTLGRDGRIRRDQVLDGTWAAELRAVEDARWTTEAAEVHETLELAARVTGCPDGTTVTIRIFREHRETDDDVIDELTATVAGGTVEASWRYEPGADEARAREQGQARFVAEVALDDACWAKTITPAVITLETIIAAQWDRVQCGRGETVPLSVEVAGFADGTSVEIEVLRRTPMGETESHASLGPHPIAGGAVVSEWTAPDEDGEFRFEAVCEGGRTAKSDWLWVANQAAPAC